MKSFRFSGRAAVICSLILAIGIPSVAMGFGEGRNLLLGKRNPSSNPPRAQHRDRDHRQQLDLRHAPVQQEGRRRRRRDLRLPLEPRQRALHPRRQPQGRPRLRVRHRRHRGRPHRDRQHRPARRSRPTPRASPPASTPTSVDGKEAADFAAATDVTALSGQPPGRAGRRRRPDPPPAAAPTVRRRRPATSTRSTFNKDVSKCSFTASPVGPPSAAAAGRRRRRRTPPISVNVDAGRRPTRSFHLQVIC